jgi:hypothetical protein
MGLQRGQTVASGSLDASGQTPGIAMGGPFVMTLSGTWAGSAVLEVSSDEGATWVPDTGGVTFTGNGATGVPNVFGPHLMVRLNWTRVSGTLVWTFTR